MKNDIIWTKERMNKKCKEIKTKFTSDSCEILKKITK